MLSYFCSQDEKNKGYKKCDKERSNGPREDSKQGVEDVDADSVAYDTGAAVDHSFCHGRGELRPVFSLGDEHGGKEDGREDGEDPAQCRPKV